MVEKDRQDESGALADRLRQEAGQARPAFSESLHARICRSVEEADMAEPSRPTARPRLVRVGLAAAVAATLAVGVFSIIGQGIAPNPVTPNPGSLVNNGATSNGTTDYDIVEPEPDEAFQAPTDVPVNAVVDLGLLVDSTLTNQRWAYLDHDARLAATLLLDQLPGSIAWPAEEP